jgi:hypothetical protein
MNGASVNPWAYSEELLYPHRIQRYAPADTGGAESVQDLLAWYAPAQDEERGLPSRLEATAGASCSSIEASCDPGQWVTVKSCDPGLHDKTQCSDDVLYRERRKTDPTDTRPLCCPVSETQPCGAKSCMCSYSQLPIADDAAFGQCGGICDDADIGDQCIVGCSDTAIGASPVAFTCIGGAWAPTGALPKCDDTRLRECPPVFNDNDATLRMVVYSGVCNGAIGGDECVIHCLPGYRPEGNATHATCSHGQWSAQLNCVPQVSCSDAEFEVPCSVSQDTPA